MSKDIGIAQSWGDVPTPEIKTILEKYSVPLFKLYDDFYDNDSSGKYREFEVFYVSGSLRGTYAKVFEKPKTNGMLDFGPSEIGDAEKIETKAKRALELDEQKVHTVVVESLKKEFQKKEPLPFDFDPEFMETMFMYLALDYAGLYTLIYDIRSLGYDIKQNYDSLEELQADMLKITPEQKTQLLALVLYKKYGFGIEGHTLNGQIIRKLAKSNPTIPVTDMEAAQAVEAAKRIERTKKKLAALKNTAAPVEIKN